MKTNKANKANKVQLVKVDTKTIEAAANDCGMTPAEYVARSMSFYKGRKVTACEAGTEGGVTAFEICSRTHTRRQLARAGRQLADMDKDGRRCMERLAVKHGTTSTEAVANVNRVLATPNGCGTLPVELEQMTTDECWERLAAKYGRPVAELRAMTADQLARLFCDRGRA